ncbi:MAG: enoyl-CoA hydratase-related protein [Bdellovibrionaceae bacterium]|nr:enoyl-CoA hydratase-related protein [Pseudobdellovibrionaceae bacterium]
MSIISLKKVKEDKVALLELNLPEKRNILSVEMIQTLTDTLNQLSKDSKIHLLVLSGAGGHFCAGGDLKWMRLPENSSDSENISQIKNLSNLFNKLSSFPFPVIGNIKGSVFGGGLGLVALCDIVVADKESRFCFSELKLALIPSLIAPYVLQKMPQSKIRELVFSARIFKAEEALQSGLLNFVGTDEECSDYIDQLTQQILNYDRIALKQCKKLLNTVPFLSQEERSDYCIRTLAERRKSPEVIKNINKFLKSRELKKQKSNTP